MRIELINTGSELLLGRVLNTHQQWIGRQLADLGYELARQTSVPDIGDAIQQAVAEALSRSELAITTGGLGPTSDDRTRELIARLLNRPLVENAAVVRHIESFFKQRNRYMPESAKAQARIPQGAQVLMNRMGTAPGLALVDLAGERKRFLLMLPGPPRELRPMFLHQGLPWLQSAAAPPAAFACRTLRAAGIRESQVEEQLRRRLQPLVERGLEIGYCARLGEVDIRFTARGDGAKTLATEAAATAKELLGTFIYGEDGDYLEAAVVKLLAAAGKTLAVAESCTGGYVAHRLTNVPGASQVFDSGLATYSNKAKVQLLGVSPSTLEVYGAVSQAAAEEMVVGARQHAGTDYALALTGIAGPTGGTAEKPAGTVFIAVADAQSTTTIRRFHPAERESFKHFASQQAFEMLRRKLLPTPSVGTREEA